ncbi:MAG: 2,3-bisphosphoglycerate-independent phosphoglycerate mutase [Proteobacteria bacterium]|nr:2,3-bisphosphoglycerate-independent phosphoglycerate mutase [Pseudomonadota bacterium]MBU1687740.1 2,3-bisphosphoglycerate-independent phosphoglycerate mutase [Pseudomonadota bacterium]
MTRKGPLLLAILDGWGMGLTSATNAITVARTPNMDAWFRDYPHTTLKAHGLAVGLPEGQMGNSEVGHLNIGAGRVVYQDLTRINKDLATGDFYRNEVLVRTMAEVKAGSGRLHLMGLVSDGGVHSHQNHLVALVEMAACHGLPDPMIHAFLDGRDTPPHSGKGYLQGLQEALARIGLGRVATVSGRYYAMDRDNRWDRVALAWEALVQGEGIKGVDPVNALQAAYDRGEADEFVKPLVMTQDDGTPVGQISSGDTVLFFNFRADRARQLTRAFTEKDFKGFVPEGRPELARFVTFTSYDKNFALPVAFPPVKLTRILGEEIGRHGLTQLRIAETEKYAHVTFFFNGGREAPFEGEERVLIPSPKEVATYDLKPEMSAYLVTDELIRRLGDQKYDLIVLNFANGDMVGHSGILPAAVRAVEAVDTCLGRLAEVIFDQQGGLLITADHGNAEQMVNPETGEPFTAHTANPVPLILVDEEHRSCRLAEGGALKDIAPTILDLLGLDVPVEMEGGSLLEQVPEV